jgi:glycosyltransferase involved in cell wall biosynthesis
MNYQNWHGFTDGRFGYGSMLNGFLSAVPDGVQISEDASVDVNMTVPFAIKGWLHGTHRVSFTMWETDTLPSRFSRWMSQYDQVLVPCQHNYEVFSPHHRDVTVVPLGVDAAFWTPQPRKDRGMFIFTCGGSLWKRKGLDIAVEAFTRLRLPDAQLWIKAAPHAQDVPKDFNAKNVRMFRSWMDPETERLFYSSSNCFVAPARGEGFGLIPLQNISLGIPTILTDTSGQAEFAHLALAVTPHHKAATQVGYWDEADVDYLAQQMLWVYENRDKADRIAQSRAHLAGEEFSWAKAAEALANALPEGRLLESGPLEEPSGTFVCRVKESCTVEVNAKAQQFLPNTDYSVTENTLDILAEAGYLER